VKVCKSRPDAKSHQSGKRANHYLEEIPDLPDTEDPTYGLFTLHSEAHDLIVVQLALDGVPIRMELDTEALLSLINKASFELISQPGQAALEQPMVNLGTYMHWGSCEDVRYVVPLLR